MPSNSAWLPASLGDLVQSAVDGPFGSNLKTEHYVSSRGVRVVRLQNVGRGKFIEGEGAFVSERHAASLHRHEVRGNDVIVASLGDEQIPFGRACLYPQDLPPGIVKADCFRLRFDPGAVVPGFVMRTLNSDSLRTALSSLAQGVTRDRVNLKNLLKFQILLPSLLEQQRIVEILDTLDEAIQKTEAIVAKLQKVKLGLLHDLLTRGIDENGELRDPVRHPEQFKESPLGRIPRGWKVLPLETVAEVRSGIAKNSGRTVRDAVSVPYLRVANVQDGYLDLEDMAEIDVPRVDIDRYRVLSGDVLMNEGGDLDKLGRGVVWTGQLDPCVHQNHVFVVRSGPKLIPSYLGLWIGSSASRRYFLRAGKQTTNLASINKTSLGGLPVLLPDKQEQEELAARLGALDNHSDMENSNVTKLRLLKQGLMDDLLTGRVRVTPLLESDP